MANQECLKITVKITKVLAYLATFVIVLASGVISKGTLLFMTSQLNAEEVVPYCNRELGKYDKNKQKYAIVMISITGEKSWLVTS